MPRMAEFSSSRRGLTAGIGAIISCPYGDCQATLLRRLTVSGGCGGSGRPRPAAMFEITFLGHQSWQFSAPGTTILLDPLLCEGFGQDPRGNGFDVFPPFMAYMPGRLTQAEREASLNAYRTREALPSWEAALAGATRAASASTPSTGCTSPRPQGWSSRGASCWGESPSPWGTPPSWTPSCGTRAAAC